ncbi:MAG: hypothetical protein J6T91_02085 [Alphaproteobacteria bacterium]|nr:hypothetical protein [Alphaproteobacteria bacterium]
MTAVQGNTGTETDVTENEKVSSEKEGAKNKSWNKIRNVVNVRQRIRQKNDSSKISPNDSEEDFDDTKTIFEEDDELNDTVDTKSEKGGLKRSDSSMTLYDESINSDNDEDTKSEKAESKNESAQSGNKLLSVIKARQRLKDMASKGSGNDQKESDSDEEKTSAEKDAELKKDKKTALDEEDEDEIDEAEDIKSEKAEGKSEPDEKRASVETDVDSKKDAKSDSGEEKASTEKGTELKKDKKTALDEEDEDEIDEAEDTKAEKVAIKTPAEIKFPLRISGIKGFSKKAQSSASPSYRRVYRDNDPEAYETPTIRRRYTFSDGDNRYSMNRTGNRNRRSSLEGTLRRSLDFSSLQKNLSGGDGDSDEDSQDQQADDSENETEGEETSTSDVSQDVMPMTNTALPMQQPDQTMNLVANENMNNQMVMQQAPYQIPATQQNIPVASGNIQNNTNPSFGESFLQNLFHTNQSDQNTSNSETKTRRGRRNRFISGIQNAYGIGKAGVQNMYGGVREVGRNLSDSEVVEKVIRYLRDLGVINESKFLKLNLKDIGTCVYCRKFSLLTMLDKEKKLGVCKTCSDQLVGDYLSGKLLGGDRYAANGYRRDSGVDIADDMVRGGINELKKEGSLEKTLSLGNIAAALGSTILNKGSSANPNEQMSQNAFGQPLMPGALPPDQIIGGGIVPGQLGVVDPQLMNQPGMPGGAMPLDQTQMLNSGAGALVGGAALGQASNFGMMGQTSNLGMNPSMTAMGTTGTGTGILSNIGKYGKVAAGVALGAAALGTGAAIWNAVKSKGKGATTEQMVLNEKGELVPLSSWNNPNAPYGYKIDPATGALVPAASAEEGLAVAQEVAATQEAANNTGTGTSNGNSKLKTAAKIAAGVAAGAAVAGAGVAAYKAWKKSKADKAEKGDEKDTDKTKSSGESDKKDTDTTKKDDSSKESSSDAQKDAPKELSPEEKKKTEEKIEDLEGDIKEVQEKIKSIEQEKQEKQKEYDDYKAKGKRVKMSVVEKEIEKLDESLKTQKENLEELQKDQKALKEKLNGDQSKSEPVKTEESKSETGKAA